jgi:hypothetical protein
MANRGRTTSLERLQAKADSIRSISLEDVDRDLSDMTGKSAERAEGSKLERSPEDDEAIAEAIGDVEQEITRDSSWNDIISLLVVMVAVLGAMFYMQSLS